MAMKRISCFLAVVLLSCLAKAQYPAGAYMSPPKPQPPMDPQRPSGPQWPQMPQTPQKPQPPQMPQTPQKPQPPQNPQPPQKPQPPQNPQPPQKPQPPRPQYPQNPQPPRPQYPQNPQPPPRPQYPQNPTKPQLPQTPSKPQYPQNPQPPKDPQIPVPPTFRTCDVAQYNRIQCGSPSISALECEAIDCCFDGSMCYYGTSVTLQCTKDAQFIIVVAKDVTLPSIDLESISFLGNDPNCGPVGTTSAFAVYQFPVTACGTLVSEESGTITYENRMTSSYEVAVGPYGAITRDTYYELLVQCKYTGTSVAALVVEVSQVPPPIPVAAPGPLRVELRLGNGVCNTKGCSEDLAAYNSFYQDNEYPVDKVLRDNVYVEVRMLERSDPNLVLTLGRCWATSDPNPYSFPQWDLLINGCPFRDDRYLTRLVPVDSSSGLQYPSHHRRFVFKMFTFVATSGQDPGKKTPQQAQEPSMMPLREMVYIHCDVTVCQPSLGDTCEPRCARKRREIAGSAHKTARPETKLVSSGGISITSPSTE